MKDKKLNYKERRIEEVKMGVKVLSLMWPEAFNKKMLPLEVGVCEKIIKEAANEEQEKTLKRTLRYWCHQDKYLKNVIKFPNRIDLDGLETTPIKLSEREHAQKVLNKHIWTKKKGRKKS